MKRLDIASLILGVPAPAAFAAHIVARSHM